MSTRPVKIVSVSIEASAQRVYDFISNPENLPKWTPKFALSVRKAGDDWIVSTSDGEMRVRFVARNDLGVVDHSVYPSPSLEIYNPMRVVRNGSGCELMFTLFRQPEMTDAQFAADAENVASDLRTLKTLMEA